MPAQTVKEHNGGITAAGRSFCRWCFVAKNNKWQSTIRTLSQQHRGKVVELALLCQFNTVVHISNLAAAGEQHHCGQRDSSGISLMQATMNWQEK